MEPVVEYSFEVYGYRFSVRGAPGEAMDGIREDFAFFSSASPQTGILIELFAQDPPTDGLPSGDAVTYTPRNVVYREGKRRYIDYHSRAMGIHDEETGNLKLYSRDSGLLYEATYLFLLAQSGAALDRRGLHRLHALAIAIGSRSVLVMLPMGGGKSTLGLHVLKHPQVRIISDDSPFIDRSGRAHAYPLRIGLLPGSEQTVPAEHRRLVHRMEFGPKHLVNYRYFQDRVCPVADPGIVLVGARILAPECVIEEIGFLTGLRSAIANCVVGLGLFQGLEFMLQSSNWEILKRVGLVVSRLRNCVVLLRRSRICRIHLGSDADLNARVLLDYCSKTLQ